MYHGNFIGNGIIKIQKVIKMMKPERSKPEYIILYEGLRDEIVRGTYHYGMKLPSKRIIAEENGISLVTVQHALELLADEGYIESRERSGYFITYQEEVFFAREKALTKSERIGITENPDTIPFTVMAKTIRKVLNDQGERILEKTEGTGSIELRRAIADYLGRSRGIYVGAEQIIIGSGSEYLYHLIVQLLGRYRIYGIEDPGYEKIQSIYRANGVRCDLLKMGDHGILDSEIRRTPASVLHVTPYHSFPSGANADATKRRTYVRWALENNGYLIEDDYDSEYTLSTKAEQTLFSLEPEEHVIYMNTFTRTVAPSLRISYMILPRRRTSQFLEKISFRSCSVSTFSQLILAELINSGNFERHINRVRRRKRREADL